MRDIVVGVDRSPTSHEAATRAAEIAAGLGVNLHVVSAVPDEATKDVDVGDGRIDWTWTGADEVDELITGLPHDRVTTAARWGDPASVLCDEAERVGAQAIVVGNLRVKGMGRALGSVAGAVLRRATCDVIVVNTTGR